MIFGLPKFHGRAEWMARGTGISCCLLVLLVFPVQMKSQTGKSIPAGNRAVTTSRKSAPEKPPNEMGKVLILEYHKVGIEESRWSRSDRNFQSDLERFYQLGFRPISLGDFIDGRISLPAGAHPFILTFDDSSPGQFRYIQKAGKWSIDPECAVGILVDFQRRHPDFQLRGIFFVLPDAAQPHKLFGQPEFEARKLQELVGMGFELGNHTDWHADLKKYPESTVRKQLALAVAAIQQRVPGYTIRALALPMGNYPADPAWTLDGTYAGIHYHHEAVLRAVGGAALSPFHRGCDFARIPRIEAVESEIRYWVKDFGQHPERYFTSDGDSGTVSCPAEQSPLFNQSRFPRLKLHTVKD
jgi:hypothetical protein